MTAASNDNNGNDRDIADLFRKPDGFAINTKCFQSMFNAIGDGMIHADLEGRILKANPAFAAMTGYAQSELMGVSIFDFLALDEQRELVRNLWKTMVQGGDPLESGDLRLHRHGRILEVSLSFWVCSDFPGEPCGVWGVIRDMSGLRAAESMARRNLEKYRFLAENSEDIIWTLDTESRYTYVSPSVEHVRGYKPEEMVGEHISKFLSEESMEVISKVAAESQARGERREPPVVSRIEVQMECKDGSVIWGESLSKPLISEDGRWTGVIGTTRDITERKRVEERLRSGEQSLLAMLNATEDAVGLFNLDGTVLAMNENMGKFLDQPAEEALGENILKYLPDNLNRTVTQAFRRAIETKRPVTEQVVWAGKILNGTVYPVVEDGEISTIAVYTRDVTEERFAEEARKKTQEQYRLIVETANEGILGLDANQRITYANKIVANFFGCSVDEIIGSNVTDFMDPQDLEDNARRMDSRLVGKRERYERRFLRKDGTEAWGLVSAAPMMAEDGRVLGAFAMIADITEVKQAHERLLTILDGIDADIYVTDFQTNEVLFMNEHMKEWLGDFEQGTRCHKIVRDLDKQCAHCPKPSLVDDHGKPVGTVVTERFYPDRKRWHLNHDRAIEWLHGRLVHMHMAADITELKTMAAQLERAMIKAEAASLAKNEFLANMSHEIRTPLNGLLGMLQLLQLSRLDEDQTDYLETALNSGRSLLQVLNDILDLSKVESGKLELEETGFELDEVLDSVISTFRHDVQMRGLDMSWEIEEDGPGHFLGDKGRLRQILFNLVGNAVKFTDVGSVKVRASALGPGRRENSQRILFEVTDTGIGIPNDKIGSIFDPFTQVDGSTTRKYQGTGLGLGIVHRLVQLMDGSIYVESEEGKGTSVYFTIEVTDAISPDLVEPAGTEERHREGLNILVAEDERVNRVVVERILARLGHNPHCVASGEEALAALKERSFDIFLTDIQMPGLDGIETARVVRDELGLDLPIIALTAHAMKGDRDRFMRSGMKGYIAKPFEIDKLQQEIERALTDPPEDGEDS